MQAAQGWHCYMQVLGIDYFAIYRARPRGCRENAKKQRVVYRFGRVGHCFGWCSINVLF